MSDMDFTVTVNVLTHFIDGNNEIAGGHHNVDVTTATRWCESGKAEWIGLSGSEPSVTPAPPEALPHKDFRPGIFRKGHVPKWLKDTKADIEAVGAEESVPASKKATPPALPAPAKEDK